MSRDMTWIVVLIAVNLGVAATLKCKVCQEITTDYEPFNRALEGVEGWKDVNTGKYGKYGEDTDIKDLDGEVIDYELESTPLQVLTDTRKGTRFGMVYLELFSTHDSNHSDIEIVLDFYDYKYYIIWCMENTILTGDKDRSDAFRMTNVPDDVTKIWTFTKTNISFTITCNDIEVASLVYADVNNTHFSHCMEFHSQKTKRIRFYGALDDASDKYRPQPSAAIPLVSPEWMYVEQNVYIDYTLDSNPIQIKTDPDQTAVGIDLYTVKGDETSWVSTIVLELEERTYQIHKCTSVSPRNMINVPDDVNKIWTLYKSSTSITIKCNNVVVVDLVYADVNQKENPACVSDLSQEVKMLKFPYITNAFDRYRKAPVKCAEVEEMTCADEMNTCVTASISTKLELEGKLYNYKMLVGKCSVDNVTCETVEDILPDMSSVGVKLNVTSCETGIQLPVFVNRDSTNGAMSATSTFLLLFCIIFSDLGIVTR